MKVWKIASRWSQIGDKSSSVVHLFRKYQVAFVYNLKPDEITSFSIENKVAPGDLMAISDGNLIVSIGKVLGYPFRYSNGSQGNKFNDDIIEYIDDPQTVIVRIQLIDLQESDRILYEKRGRFHELHHEMYSKIASLWESQFDFLYNKLAFKINAQTKTLLNSSDNESQPLLTNEIRFIIPIYQRPYSWEERDVERLLNDLLRSFKNEDGEFLKEPMFIGTMQLSEKRFVENNIYEQDIIDGQQRLTTFLILFKVLQEIYPHCQSIKNLPTLWLNTRVNNGEQQKLLDTFLSFGSLSEQGINNQYIKNAILIKELLKERFGGNGVASENQIREFVSYLASQVYFVVIETRAGLSKTLQIFNTINTAGMDLNLGDLFKIRCYEYLRQVKNQPEAIFEQISELYKQIDAKNSEINRSVTNMPEILRIYQYVLIAKYNLPKVLYSYGTDTFYDRLFDTLLNINSWEHYKDLNGLEINIVELNSLINARFAWQTHNYPTIEDACAMQFIWISRYSKHWILAVILWYRFNPQGEKKNTEAIFGLLRTLSKLLIIYSTLYQKAIGEAHDFIYTILTKIMNPTSSIEIINQEISEKINSGTFAKGDNRDAFTEVMENNIFYNAKLKGIVCRLSAMLEELNCHNMDPHQDIDQIVNKLFIEEIDIEHIQSLHDDDIEKRQVIIDDWGDEINSIGNLMILERNSNRSVSNRPYKAKLEQYKKSKYEIVKKQSSIEIWNKEESIKRKMIETEKLVTYLFCNKLKISSL